MERLNFVIPECYVDTNLINVLTGKFCNHQKGCPNVCKTLKDKFKEEFAIGIIDKDKRIPTEALNNYCEIAKSEYLILLKHKCLCHYIIQINPAVEIFILEAAKNLNINLDEFGLSSDLSQLKKFTKSSDAKDNKLFSDLFKSLAQASNMKQLKAVLDYLLKNKYKVESSELEKLILN